MNLHVLLVQVLILGTAVNATSDTIREIARQRSRVRNDGTAPQSSEQHSLDPITGSDRSKASPSGDVVSSVLPKQRDQQSASDTSSQPDSNGPFSQCLQPHRADEMIDMHVESSTGPTLVAYCIAPGVTRRLYQVTRSD